MNEENPFKKMKEENMTKELPEEVMERLQKHSERTGETLPVVKQGFFDYIKTNYSVEDWQDEDEDLVFDWAEQFATKLRSSTVSGGINTETAKWVISAGADVLVAGTAVFGGGAHAGSYEEKIQRLCG